MATNRTEPVMTADSETLKAQLEEANKKLDKANTIIAQQGISEDLIAEVEWRMRAGLSREEAYRVARRNKLTQEAAKEPDLVKRANKIAEAAA